MVGSDSGTHALPATHDVYETITGERYAVRTFGGGATSRLTETEAGEMTDGRIRLFGQAEADIRAARRKLADLRKML